MTILLAIPPEFRAFLLGAIALACAAVSIFFLRFWRRTHDHLFLAFSVAFALLVVSFSAQTFIPDERDRVVLYVVRLAAYGLIIVGIVAKNMPKNPAA